MEKVEVLVGVIGRAHGIKGEVSLELCTDEPLFRFAPGAVLTLHDPSTTLTVAASRQLNGRFFVTFVESPTRTAAEQLRGVELYALVDPTARPAAKDEFYDRQLVGLAVQDAAGAVVGKVNEVWHLPAQDVLSVETANGERLVPFVQALVPVVDLDGGFLRLAPVGGLLEDLPADPAEPSEVEQS